MHGGRGNVEVEVKVLRREGACKQESKTEREEEVD